MRISKTKILLALVVAFTFVAFAAPSFASIQATPKSEKAIAVQLSKGTGQQTAETHRSVVATFVQNLLSVADREGGIGQEVRAIAQEQNDSNDRVSEGIAAVENRSKVKTFLIGSDYKNLGALRSEMVKTRNSIDQLKRLVDKTTNEQDKVTLESQITALEQEQLSIDDFVTKNESKFSLFGWALKLFSK